MRGLDLNTYKPNLAISEFFNLTGKIAKFQKIWISERNLTPNYSKMRKLHMNRQDLRTQAIFDLGRGKIS